MSYSYSFENELSQGDIIHSVRIITNITGDNGNPKYKESDVIVISRNCDISKPATNANAVHVARVRKVSSESARFQGYIRDNSIVNAFYLPANMQYLEESYVDWRTLQFVDKIKLYALRGQREYYVCTLTEQYLRACLGGLWEFYTRPE